MSSNVPARVAAGSEEADQQLAALAAELAKAEAAANAPPTPAPVEPPTPAPAPQPSVQPVNDEYLRQMQARLDTTNGRLEQLSEANARLQQQLAERVVTPAPPAAPPAPTRQLTDADLSEFGEDTISMVRRCVADETSSLRAEVERLRTQLSGMEGRVQRTSEAAETAVSTVAKTANDKYLERLTAEVPDWQQINHDPKFEVWLAQIDQFSARKRHDLLLEAHKGLDAGRVIAIFTAYKQGLETGTPAAPAPTAPPPAVDPNTQVAPSTTSAAPAPASASGGKVYASTEYDDMHSAMLRKRISKDEFAAFEKDYLLAVAEGRVRFV